MEKGGAWVTLWLHGWWGRGQIVDGVSIRFYCGKLHGNLKMIPEEQR
ncbi:Hypothetical protein Cp262_2235 [Corynebacterium pseudotuberculosis]|nr:Hypothetical protein Cp262_2235 [Corynebacterium pseudotuberculosis]ATB62955.1 Hypothetical protein BFF96_2091 [Corynebacterium pseudotuberculosis]AUY61455.1 Hypothetical protein BFG00_2073 [Corynebacterium pseudotuberculosis]KEX87436.1 hypothetical protein CPTD_02190 [Corynebacterium pseudotuberculosis]